MLQASAPTAWAQYYQSADEDVTAPAGGNAGTANLSVRLTQMEEHMRQLQGTLEQISNENRQLRAQMDKANADMQYRLNALEQKQGGGAPAPAGAAPPTDGDVSALPEPPAGEGESEPPAPAMKFNSAREHYNYANDLLNHAKYPEAGASFAAFTKQYPHDPLIGNGYYWLGETHYARRDYIKAADSFRQGYEAMPTGPKAGDNLLKLAMSLGKMKKNKEACVVFKQVVAKFGATSTSLASRANQEISRAGCQ